MEIYNSPEHGIVYLIQNLSKCKGEALRFVAPISGKNNLKMEPTDESSFFLLLLWNYKAGSRTDDYFGWVREYQWICF
jgi:hypothetical protein